MTDASTGSAPGAAPTDVSPDNPCPFLRALVANGYVGGHVVPLPKLAETIGRASGKAGLDESVVELKTWMVAVGANGPFHIMKSAISGAVLDELRNGPLDKHGAGSRILGVDAHVHEDEITRLGTFGKDRPDGAGGTELGLNAKEIETYMAANMKRAGAEARFYYPIADEGRMAGPARHLGQGRRRRALSQRRRGQDAVRRETFPDRIVARLAKPPAG